MNAVKQGETVSGHRHDCQLVIDEKHLCRWLGSAEPGDIVEYHRGFLALDTMPHGSWFPEHDRVELCRVARRTQWAFQKGLVHLLQRRNGPADFIYLAVARRREHQHRLRDALNQATGEEVLS